MALKLHGKFNMNTENKKAFASLLETIFQKQSGPQTRLRNGTEPAVFFPEVTKQHDVFAGRECFRSTLIPAAFSFAVLFYLFTFTRECSR